MNDLDLLNNVFKEERDAAFKKEAARLQRIFAEEILPRGQERLRQKINQPSECPFCPACVIHCVHEGNNPTPVHRLHNTSKCWTPTECQKWRITFETNNRDRAVRQFLENEATRLLTE